MSNRKNVLGLHTLEEQSVALRMAMAAEEAADLYVRRRNFPGLSFEYGYVRAIRDLAEVEGASKLVKALDPIVLKLRGYVRIHHEFNPNK